MNSDEDRATRDSIRVSRYRRFGHQARRRSRPTAFARHDHCVIDKDRAKLRCGHAASCVIIEYDEATPEEIAVGGRRVHPSLLAVPPILHVDGSRPYFPPGEAARTNWAVSEIAGNRSTLLSRGMGALAAAQTYFPGVLVSLIIAVAATFLSEHYGGPVMLFALLLGMAFYFLSQQGPCAAGIEFASKRVLRVAVGLLGAQITISEILKLGPTPVIMVIGAVTLTILFGAVGARVAGLSRPFGILTSGAVAICGASAALAISSVLPKGENHERDTVFTVIGVTALSTIAMIVYPLVIALFHLDHAAIGVFLGGTIHDVAQVVGAGFTVSEETGNVATFTKLLRVAMLLPVVVTLSVLFRAHNSTKAGRQLPGFLVVFALLVVVNSLGVIPVPALAAVKSVSRWCLVTAIAALGMKTSLKAMAEVGGRAVALIVAETVFLAILVLVIVVWRF